MLFPGKEKREKKKKEQAVEQVLLERYDHYFRLAYSYVHNEADAADIVQNGAYQAILNSNNLREEAYAATWVYRIMLNEIFDFMKKESYARGGKVVPFDASCVEQGEEDCYEDVDLTRALDAMAPEDQAVIKLKYFEDMKLSEIAEALGENVNTVKSRLYRALKKLRLELDDGWQFEQ